jgi:hypothetical protein
MLDLPQDFRDVLEKNVPTSGRISRPPHWGHAGGAFSCSLMVMVTVTSRWHFSQ